MKHYEDMALSYAEQHGILDYKVKGASMIYYANYPKYLAEPHRTYKVVYNLKSKTETRILLKRWNKLGNANMYRQKG